MTTASDRLSALGLTLPAVAAPAGTYVPARRLGDVIYTSGQLPFANGELLATGHVGDSAADVSSERASQCAVTCVLNALAAAAAIAGGLDAITGVIRLTAFVAATPTFTGHPAVLNQASALLGDIFGDDGRHARSVVGVASLPLGAPVEAELIVTTGTAQ